MHRQKVFLLSSQGFGQAIKDALTAGCQNLMLGLGGSGSSDGGQAALTALGARFKDRWGLPVGMGNSALRSITRVDVRRMIRPPVGGHITVLSDVTNPLLGDTGAINVFGKQKGITEKTATVAEANMEHFARQLRLRTAAA